MPPENEQPKPAPALLQVDLDAIGSEAPAELEVDRESKRESKELFGEPKRREELRQLLHEALVITLRVALLLFLIVIIIRVLHFILPENDAANAGKWFPHGWLTDSQLGSIDKFFFGALGTIVAQYIRNLIAKDRTE